MISRVNHHQKMSFSKCMSGDIFLLILLVAADQGAKWLSYLYLKGQPSVSLIPGALELRYLENRGAAFGILQNQKIFFVLMTSLILLACIYALWRMPAARKYTMLHILGAILMAGALGNFFDRIRLDYVVDFIYISLIDFPIFNVADIYVTFVCAAGLCLAFFGHFEEKDFDFLKRRKPDSKKEA